jgi:hypothetical protein
MWWRRWSTFVICLLIGCARAPARPIEPTQPVGEVPAEAPPPAELPAEPSPAEPVTEPATTEPAATEPAATSAPQPPAAKTRPRRAAAAYGGSDPCELAIRGDSPVGRACREGGIKAAKSAMKDLVRRAKAGGLRLDCDDCHASPDDYGDLKSDARQKFSKLLAAAAVR